MGSGRLTRHATRAVVVAAWLIVGVLGVLTITQAIDVTGSRVVAVAQSLTPYWVLVLVPIIVVALARHHLMLATVGTAVGFGIAVLAVPAVAPNPQAEPLADAVGLRVASANLWYQNTEVAIAADDLAGLDADVLVLSEFTTEHQATLEASTLADSYPNRSEVHGSGPTRLVVWSRVPIIDQRGLDTHNGGVGVTVRGPDGDVDLVAVHMPTPIAQFDSWQHELAMVAEAADTATAPLLVIGDLNATYWHPDFRQLLDSGLVDAHIAAGRGMSTSWPIDWLVPPFVRLDHALTGGGLVSTDVVDVDVTGSDHQGLMVTVAPAQHAAP